MKKVTNTHSNSLRGQQFWTGFFFSVLLSCFVSLAHAEGQEKVISHGFTELAIQLTSKSYKAKQRAIAELSNLNDPRVKDLFKQLLESKLYYLKDTKQLVYITSQEKDFAIRSIIDGQAMGVRKKNQLKKVRTNNKIRTLIKSEIAKRNLNSTDPTLRYKAVKKMFSQLSPKTIDLFRERTKVETDAATKSFLTLGLAIGDLQSANGVILMDAIKMLGGSLYPEAKNALEGKLALLKKVASPSSDIEKQITTIKAALKSIDEKRSFFHFVENVFFGLSLGSVLLLAAIGLAITFGVMGVINMAHGELIMLGAYTTYFVQALMPNYIDFSLLIAVPAAFIVSGLFGMAIERGVIRHLYGRPLETLLATFGISLILQQLVRTTISAQNVIVSTPSWLSGSLQINPILSITYNRAFIIIFSLAVFAALLFILHKTVLGLQIRAVSQNRSMAKAMGVRSNWVDALTFGLGAGIAGIAGVALSQLTNVGPNMGQAYIIDSFMVVVFGGVGNLWGTMVGALSLGVLNKFLEPWAGAVMAKILVLIFIILFIQKKPRGLFPKKGRFAEESD